MKKDLMFGVKALIVSLVLVCCINFLYVAMTSLGLGLLMLSTVLMAFPVTYIRLLWEKA